MFKPNTSDGYIFVAHRDSAAYSGVSDGSRKFNVETDERKCDSTNVPNGNEKCLIQGHSYVSTPNVPYLIIQSGKMSPDHKGQTGDCDISGIQVIFDILVYVGISFVYAEWNRRLFEPCTVPLVSIQSQSRTPSLKDRPERGPKPDQSPITRDQEDHNAKEEERGQAFEGELEGNNIGQWMPARRSM